MMALPAVRFYLQFGAELDCGIVGGMDGARDEPIPKARLRLGRRDARAPPPRVMRASDARKRNCLRHFHLARKGPRVSDGVTIDTKGTWKRDGHAVFISLFLLRLEGFGGRRRAARPKSDPGHSLWPRRSLRPPKGAVPPSSAPRPVARYPGGRRGLRLGHSSCVSPCLRSPAHVLRGGRPPEGFPPLRLSLALSLRLFIVLLDSRSTGFDRLHHSLIWAEELFREEIKRTKG